MKPVALAAIYGVDPRQVRRWVELGLHPEDPQRLFVELSKQRRPGRTFLKLADEASRAQIQDRINEATQNQTECPA